MGLPPAAVWSMTLVEINLALDGWASVHAPQDKPEPLTRDELDDLMARYPD